MAKKDDPEREQFKAALAGLIGGRVVAYYPLLARRIGGVKAAVMLSQLIYWMGDKTVRERDGHWVYKSVEEMEEETGLTILEQQTARKVLRVTGVVYSELRGVPRIWRYQVNMDRLTDILLGPSIDRQTHSMANPLNGNPIERLYHSMARPVNVVRQTDGTFAGKPTQLKEESKITEDLKITSEITTTTTDLPAPEELVVVVWNGAIEKLRSMGIWEDTIPDFITHAQTHGWTEQQLINLASSLTDRYEQARACALLKHRIESEKPSSYIGYAHLTRPDQAPPGWHLSDACLDVLEQAGLHEADLDELDTIAATQGWSSDDVTAMLSRYLSAMDLLTDARNNPRSMRR